MSEHEERDEHTNDEHTHAFSISSEHEEWGPELCQVFPEEGHEQTFEELVPYRVVIHNRRSECYPDYYGATVQVDDGQRQTIDPGGSVEVERKAEGNDVVVKIWTYECDWDRGPDQSPKPPSDPKTPRITLTLTKKGED